MDKKLKVKDLVMIGVFTVIYFVGMYSVGMMGIVPILFLVWPSVNGMVLGMLVMVFMAKIQKPWALFIFGMMTPLSMFLMGHSYIVLINGLVFMLIADFMRRRGDYKSFKYNAIANGFFSLWAPGSLLQLLFVKGLYRKMTVEMMGEKYFNTLDSLVSYQSMVLVYIGAFLGGIIGAYLGRKVLKKHFIKAGIV